eukprot:1151182-Pelagomonas_calceolata.AAC.1
MPWKEGHSAISRKLRNLLALAQWLGYPLCCTASVWASRERGAAEQLFECFVHPFTSFQGRAEYKRQAVNHANYMRLSNYW